ncbi:MAG: hypothetical protein H6619_07050 [Deltaproteobacteria bacterium]|nr:hypothetical protein [Deltaproteobacteria bacterium]
MSTLSLAAQSIIDRANIAISDDPDIGRNATYALWAMMRLVRGTSEYSEDDLRKAFLHFVGADRLQLGVNLGPDAESTAIFFRLGQDARWTNLAALDFDALTEVHDAEIDRFGLVATFCLAKSQGGNYEVLSSLPIEVDGTPSEWGRAAQTLGRARYATKKPADDTRTVPAAVAMSQTT